MRSRCLLLVFAFGCSSPAEAPARTPATAEPAAAPAPPPPVTLEDPTGSLAPFYRSLSSGGRTLIAQFGDSHTAGDRFTGRLREVLQARHGDAGRGFVLTGRPAIKHYELRDLTYGASGWGADWVAHGDDPYGLGGVRSHAKRPSAEAWIETAAVASFEIFFLRRPEGGVIEARVDDGPATTIDTSGEVTGPDYATIEVADGSHRLSLRPARGGKAISVFGVALERKQPGVVVDGLGIVGLQMSHLWASDWDVIGAQLAHRDPALVVLQYGTNEVDDRRLDLAELEARWVELLARIKAAVPDAGVLVLGPPDMGEREHTRKECERLQKKLDRQRRKAKDPAGVPAVPEGCTWHTPPELLAIIEVERRAARTAGVAFFDSFTALGGADRIDAMVHADPPLAYEDHVHLTAKGYAAWADLVLEDLMRGLAAWEKLPRR